MLFILLHLVEDIWSIDAIWYHLLL